MPDGTSAVGFSTKVLTVAWNSMGKVMCQMALDATLLTNVFAKSTNKD